LALKTITLENKIFDINYNIINPQNKKTIIFLHGWGSNKEIMAQAFSNYFKDFKHIYIDMPGFGKSSNKYILKTEDYKDIIAKFLQTINIKYDNSIILGHSFGGKIATLLNPALLILVSSAGIIEEKSTKTLLTIRMAKIFNKFGLNKVTKLLRSSDVNMMSENMYETFKNVVDEDFSLYFKNFKNKTLIFWGDNDTATSLQSGKTIHSFIQNSDFFSYDGDHFFFLKYNKQIVDKIEGVIDETNIYR